MRLDREKSSISFELADAGHGARLLSSGTFSVVLQDTDGQNGDGRNAGEQAVSTYGGDTQGGGPEEVP